MSAAPQSSTLPPISRKVTPEQRRGIVLIGSGR
jgi:hypothetical protein